MKMEKKQCTKCKHFLLFECFKNKKTSELTKCCVKCLEKSKEQTKCKHGRQRSYCKDCGGSQIYKHNKIKSQCKDCGRSQICEYNERRSQCLFCGRGQICVHNKQRSRCKDCGGSQICEHNKIKSQRKDCGRGQVCEHNKIKSGCKDCDPLGYLAGVVRPGVYTSLKNDKQMISTEYLGCNIETFKNHVK